MKQRHRISILVIIAAFLVTSCATTSISFLNNPEIKLSSFNKIMVFAPFQDISWRKSMESYFVEEFTKKGKNAVSSIEIVSPLKTYTNEEFNTLLMNAGIDAVISIIVVDAYTDQAYIPQTSTTTGSARAYGNTVYGQSRTTTSGGYYVSKPRVKFEVNLFETKTGILAWKATAFTAGNAFADTNTLFRSLATKVVEEYIVQP
jgi:hypothetical protein